MNTKLETAPLADVRPTPSPVVILRAAFIKLGVLPFFLVAALIIFTIASRQFLTLDNITNVARQSA